MSDLDLSKVGREIETTVSYTWKDCVLYAVGIGAQAEDLPFVYEGNPGGLKVFPSYATIVGGGAVRFNELGNIDYSRFIHGEQLIRLHKPFKPEGTIIRKGKIANIYDKGKAAVIKSEVQGFDENNNHIFDFGMTQFYKDHGGFGGERGPKSEQILPPEGVEPDFSITYETTENQAALYRLSGDFNPLHIDPDFARGGGQEKPILHGLCTYGFATRAILYGLCDGDVGRFKEFNARFSDVVYPGESLTTEGWKKGDRYIIRVKSSRDTIVLSNAYAIVG